MGYVYVMATVLLTVYGQVVFKWRIDRAGDFPADTGERLRYVAELAVNPWIISVFLAVVAASVTWGAALTRFELSFAYPFMSLSFVLVLLLGVVLFSEAMTAGKVAALVLICTGLFVGSRF
jgi:multidrug transporter EmrE-like cation transporter